MASSITVTNLITKVQHEIGEVAGDSVQIYSEDRILDKLKQCFNLVYTKYGWPHYTEWMELSLDGTTGKITTNAFQNVKGPEDLLFITRAGENKQLGLLPSDVNPFVLSGTNIAYMSYLPVTDSDYGNKIIQFWPKTATQDVVVKARIYPTTFNSNTELWLDEDMLVYGTSWMILADEGLNPDSVDKNKELFDMRYGDIIASFANMAIENKNHGRGFDYMNDWRIGV